MGADHVHIFEFLVRRWEAVFGDGVWGFQVGAFREEVVVKELEVPFLDFPIRKPFVTLITEGFWHLELRVQVVVIAV